MSPAWQRWLLVIVATVGATGSLVMLQVLVAETGWRIDLTPDHRYALSVHANQVLAAIDGDVVMTAFLRSEDPRNPDITDLLDRVAAASPHVRYRVIDVNRSPAVARQYGVDRYGSIVVESGPLRRDIGQPDEQLLMAAVLQVTRPARRVVYFLTGQGERSPTDPDAQGGYSRAHVALVHELYEVADLELSGGREVPDDASALIIAGPRRDLSAEVLDRVDAYVRRGGGLLVLLDPGHLPDLVAYLRNYGVVVLNEVVLDAENRLFAGDYLTILVPGTSAKHPVSASLGAKPLLSEARPVRFVGTVLTAEGTDLLKTAGVSWRTAELGVQRSGVGRYVAGRDTRGPVTVGVSVAVRSGETVAGRVMVIGDSDFASNAFLEYLGNRDLFLNSINWLAGEETLVSSRPSPQLPGVNQLFISAEQGRRVLLLGTLVQPAVLLVIGFSVVALRRRRG